MGSYLSFSRKEDGEEDSKCQYKNCACKFSLEKIARNDLSWAQLEGSQDIILKPSNTPQVQNEVTSSNSLVLMSLGDKLGEMVMEAKEKAATSNLPQGVLELDTSHETIQALVRFASEGRVDLQHVSEQIREELLKFSISFSVPGLQKVCGEFLLENLAPSNASKCYITAMEYLCLAYQTPVRTFILRNFIQIAQEDTEFVTLVQYFDDILPDDQLNAREEQLFLILQKLAEENPDMVN